MLSGTSIVYGVLKDVRVALRKNPERNNLEFGKRDNPESENLEKENLEREKI